MLGNTMKYSTNKLNIRKLVSFSKDEKINLSGIFIPVPTPFRNDRQQTVYYDKLVENLEKWEQIAFKGYCFGGTNGEWPFLNREERIGLVEFAKSIVSKDKLIIAGTTSESTEETCRLSEDAVNAGADAILVMVPFYFKNRMTEESIINHFTEVADRSPVPLIIYNMVVVTGIDISINAIQILSQHPNICGIKDADVSKITCTVQKTRTNDFQVLAGSAGFLLPALMAGASGGINGLAAVLGKPLCDIWQHVNDGKLTKALKLHAKISQPDFLLLRELGPPGLKAAMDVVGLYGGNCRRPLLQPSEHTKQRIINMLKEYEN